MQPNAGTLPTDSEFGAPMNYLRSFIDYSGHLVLWVERILVALACTAMASIMIIVSVDSVCRYAFNSPLGFTSDLVILYLLPVSMFFAFSYTFTRDGHIAVDAFAKAIPRRVRRFIIGGLLLVSAVLLMVSARRVGLEAFNSWASGENTGGVYPMPIWPSKSVVPIGLGVLVLRLLHAGLAGIFEAATGQTPDGDATVEGLESDRNSEEYL